MLESVTISFLGVAIAEIGDKTQLLSLSLAARFRSFWSLTFGILFATLANHAAASALGIAAADMVDAPLLRYIVSGSFIALGIWTLFPDKADENVEGTRRFGPFLTSFIAFFIAEIGDKTQVATIAFAARYQDMLAVLTGSTAGMMMANVPVLLLGSALADRLPLKPIRITTAILFLLFGVFGLFGADFPSS